MQRIVLVAMLGLSACASEAPPAVFVGSEWRSADGHLLTTAEFESLRDACRPQLARASLDPNQPVPNPQRDNPAYHPGGEGFAGAPPVGIAAIGKPVNLLMVNARPITLQPLDECLEQKGLIRNW